MLVATEKDFTCLRLPFPTDHPVSLINRISVQVAEDIGAGLSKAALAGKVNGQLVDTSFLIGTRLRRCHHYREK